MKLQLINAPLSPNVVQSTRSGVFPPVNLLALSNFIKRKNHNIQVEILDGDLLTLEDIAFRIDADWVAIGSTIMSYPQAIELSRIASGKGCKVILGGQHVSVIWESILKNQSQVEVVIRGNGEEALNSILESNNYEMVPNVCFRKNGQYISNTLNEIDFSKLPVLDYEGIDLSKYEQRFRKLHHFKKFHRCGGIYIQKGCSWQDMGRGCIFCRKSFESFRIRQPEQMWDDIINVNENYGVDFFHDVSDEFTSDIDWLKRFVSIRISDISPGLMIFSRADQITSEVAALLKKINCIEVLIGVESGDNDMLKKIGKPVSTEECLNATRILNDQGILVYPTFLFGLPDESEETVDKTIRFAEEIISIGNVKEISCSILLPVPGAPSFNMLRNEYMYDPIFHTDYIVPEKIREMWVNTFCCTSIEKLYDAIQTLMKITPIVNRFGMNL